MRYQVIAPRSLEEALELLRENDSLYPVAGGTDILPRVNQKIESHPVYMLLGGIPGLSYITSQEGRTFIGALTTLTAIAEADMLPGCRALQDAASKVASPQIRNNGTVGGNLLQENRCIYFNQSCSWRREACCFKLGGDRCYQYKGSKECVALFQSDTAPALMSLGAEVVLTSEDGSRVIPLADLYLPRGRANKTLRKGELLTEVRLPDLTGVRSAYERETIRGSIDFPLISCAAALRVENGIITHAGIVIGCAASRPAHAEKAEAMLIGKTPEEARALIPEAAEKAKSVVMPFRDSRVDGPVRKAMCGDTVVRALTRVL